MLQTSSNSGHLGGSIGGSAGDFANDSANERGTVGAPPPGFRAALDLGAFNLGTLDVGEIDRELLIRHRVLPLRRRGDNIVLATAQRQPPDAALARWREAGGHAHTQGASPLQPPAKGLPTWVFVEEAQLAAAIDRVIARLDTAILEDVEPTLAAKADAAPTVEGMADAANDEAPIVQFVDRMLATAIKRGASDIHFEPFEGSNRVRMRIDGVLHEISRPPADVSARLTARLKIMAALDISERRVPQDGRTQIDIGTGPVDLRVATLPTIWGEKVVLRLLDGGGAHVAVDALGMRNRQKRLYLDALEQPQGMILVTGPTGSGKTATLYAGLKRLNDEARNIATVEDPVEIRVDGINQVQVHDKVGLTFATALRAFLRQDPDVLMVGEIRDLATADTAIKAAQTGHLVLATLHTNSAPETVVRLTGMGVSALDVATTVSLVIAQRLVRLLCPHCKRPVDWPQSLIDKTAAAMGLEGGSAELGVAGGGSAGEPPTLFEENPAGCAQCTNGFRGRTGLYEMMACTPPLRELILTGGNALDIAALAFAGDNVNLHRAGLARVLAGETTLAEVQRVAG